MKYFIYLLTVFCLYSCAEEGNQHSEEIVSNQEVSIIIEKGRLFDSIPIELRYFSYEKLNTDTCINHIYTIDSINYLYNSQTVSDEALEYYNGYQGIYYQSKSFDTLYTYEKNSTDYPFFYYSTLVNSIVINTTDSNYTIYKYRIPNPAMDGDLTTYFNESIGIIESYNIGWQNRQTTVAHSVYGNEIMEILDKMKKDSSFYNPIKPISISETMKK
ncbi:MAG: hypothetical protein H6600_09430 [Flavobacteriales bacterium]|nr:hypothetical protein [Flavobacteriales bacterium]MCB9198670.1 hypothetical protein [Flavobacteriales bacterium]